MPHKQKENHDHSSKSKKERTKAKQAKLERKKAEALKKAEAEAAALLPNNVALAEGAGAYEIGIKEQHLKELPKVKVNLKKRSKKHLRQDVRWLERRKQEEEDAKRILEQEPQEQEEDSSQSEQDSITTQEEYLVYICECCRKKYSTTNQFANHANSKKHKFNAALYEQAGIIVTSVQLVQRQGGNSKEEQEFDEYDDCVYDDGDEDEVEYAEEDYANTAAYDYQVNVEKDESDDDEELQPKPKINPFTALFMDDSDSDNDSSESSHDDESDRKMPATDLATEKLAQQILMEEEEQLRQQQEQAEIDAMLEEIIYQNHLAAASNENKSTDAAAAMSTPLPFDHALYDYDPNHYTVNENRLISVHYRIQKRLAAKGIESSRQTTTSEAISIGKTLLQQLMEAKMDTLQTKLEAYNRHKAECQLLIRGFRFAKGNSKALPSQYSYRPDAADDTRKRANVHHTGSHYHMQAARSMQFGRSKGLLARHSSQGARLQAQRMKKKAADKQT